jgi:thiol-disulfide isomerase/thioredoxin
MSFARFRTALFVGPLVALTFFGLPQLTSQAQETKQTPPQKITLAVGSPAPKLQVGEWVKGAPVTITPGKVHVVEFWATWCGPCRESVPHLTKLAKKYAGHTKFVGVSVGEEGEDIPGQVKDFVRRMGKQMEYHVARDDAKNTMMKTWFRAAGQTGIPVAFIVNRKGKIAWIGYPNNVEFEIALVQTINAK